MEQTSLTKASPKTKSLRTTVPNSIVNQFNLTESDKLNTEESVKWFVFNVRFSWMRI
jgi:hypothetical protein